MRLQQGRYYGHPNPYRDECVFNDGSFQGVAPPPNYEQPTWDLGANRSANGTIEYTSSEWHCGALEGDLLIANYSVGDDLTRVELSEDGHSVLRTSSLVGGFDEPLPLAQDPDGTIYVGEFSAGNVTSLVPDDIGLLDERRRPLPCELLDAGGAALGGKLYVVGGEDSNGHLSTLRVHDPVTTAWTAGPPLPGPAVENPAVMALGGKLYVFGGSTAVVLGAVTNAAVFDPATNSWTTLPEMPTARGGATAQAIGGQIYVAGGLGTDGASLSSVDVFDPSEGASGGWGSAAAMATRRDNSGSGGARRQVVCVWRRHSQHRRIRAGDAGIGRDVRPPHRLLGAACGHAHGAPIDGGGVPQRPGAVDWRRAERESGRHLRKQRGIRPRQRQLAKPDARCKPPGTAPPRGRSTE